MLIALFINPALINPIIPSTIDTTAYFLFSLNNATPLNKAVKFPPKNDNLAPKPWSPSSLGTLLILTPLIFAIGSVLVGLYQGGVPSEDGLHGLGARLSFLGGNFTALISGIALFSENKKYGAVSILLGIIGLVSAGFMNNAINNNLSEVVAIYERMTVYPITIWQLITGIVFLKKK